MSDYIYPPPKSLPRGSVVIAYARDSGGGHQEDSIPQQEKVIRDFCKQHGLILAKVYSDTASGRNTKKRKHFLEMCQVIENMPDDLRPRGLLLWSFSRFSRAIRQFNRHIYTLLDVGIVIHSLTEEIPEGIAGQVMLSFIAYKNEGFSIELGKQIKRAIAANVEAGYSNGGKPPRGYIAVRDNEGVRRDGKKRNRIKWEPDPELAPLVVLAWELRAQGKGYAEITKATGGRIYKTKNSWGSHFRNKSYLGIGKAGDLEIPDHHTPIITWELWEAVKKIEATMPSHSRSGDLTHPRRIGRPSLLSGLAYCVKCGAAMVLHTSKDYRSYQCGKKDRQRGAKDCNARGVNARIADRVILDAVLSQIMSPSFVDALCSEISGLMIDTKQLDHELGLAKNLLIDTEGKISRLLALAEETGEIKELAQRLNQLRQDRDEHNARVKRLKAERAQEIAELTPEALSLWFSILREQIQTATQSGDILTAKRLLSRIVSKIELGRDESIIHLEIPDGIPSDGSGTLCAHTSPAKCGTCFINPMKYTALFDNKKVIRDFLCRESTAL